MVKDFQISFVAMELLKENGKFQNSVESNQKITSQKLNTTLTQVWSPKSNLEL